MAGRCQVCQEGRDDQAQSGIPDDATRTARPVPGAYRAREYGSYSSCAGLASSDPWCRKIQERSVLRQSSKDNEMRSIIFRAETAILAPVRAPRPPTRLFPWRRRCERTAFAPVTLSARRAGRLPRSPRSRRRHRRGAAGTLHQFLNSSWRTRIMALCSAERVQRRRASTRMPVPSTPIPPSGESNGFDGENLPASKSSRIAHQ